jgi:hypothetical protein
MNTLVICDCRMLHELAHKVYIIFIPDTFQKMVQISRQYDSTFCLWKGYELFVFAQDIKHIAVSCLLHSYNIIIYILPSIHMKDMVKVRT